MAEPIPSGYCGCGCGAATEIATTTRPDRQWIKGQPKPFVGSHRHRMRGLAYRLNEAYTVDPDGCWRWHRALTSAGYGYVRVRGVLQPAHRVVYELHRGPIPEGLHLDHLCRNPPCVNPDHLEPVTETENIRRGAVVRTGISIEDYRAVAEDARALRDQGMSYQQIAGRLGVSIGTVWRRLHA